MNLKRHFDAESDDNVPDFENIPEYPPVVDVEVPYRHETKFEWLQRQRTEMNADESRMRLVKVLMAKHPKGSEKHKLSMKINRAFSFLIDKGFSYRDSFEFIFLLYE